MTQEHNIKVDTRKDFFIIYAKILSAYFKKLDTVQIKVLAYLLEKYEKDETIIIDKKVKEVICKEMDIKHVNSVSNALTHLNPFLLKEGRGVYKFKDGIAFEEDIELTAIFKLGFKDLIAVHEL